MVAAIFEVVFLRLPTQAQIRAITPIIVILSAAPACPFRLASFASRAGAESKDLRLCSP